MPEVHAPRLERVRVAVEQILAAERMAMRVDHVGAGQIDLHRRPSSRSMRAPLRTATGSVGSPRRHPDRRTASASPRRVARNVSNRNSPIASRRTDDAARCSAASGKEAGSCRTPRASTVVRRQQRRILLGRRRQAELALQAIQPCREHRPDGEVGVRGAVDRLHLDVRRARGRRRGPRDEPERGLAVLDTPALHRARPVMRLEPQVAGDRRRRDRDQSRAAIAGCPP